MTEFEKEIALIEKMGLKTSPLRLEYEMLREKKTCKQIIESASRPIEDLDNRLTLDGFQQWYKTY